jgi:hypothetical protein
MCACAVCRERMNARILGEQRKWVHVEAVKKQCARAPCVERECARVLLANRESVCTLRE